MLQKIADYIQSCKCGSPLPSQLFDKRYEVMNSFVKPNLQGRLEDGTHKIEELRKICGVPSISIGIVHLGEVVLRKSFGFCDIENRVLANSDTMYLLSSLSKGFVSAAAGIAVNDGKMDWLTPLSKVLPRLQPNRRFRNSQECNHARFSPTFEWAQLSSNFNAWTTRYTHK